MGDRMPIDLRATSSLIKIIGNILWNEILLTIKWIFLPPKFFKLQKYTFDNYYMGIKIFFKYELFEPLRLDLIYPIIEPLLQNYCDNFYY